uniref:Uncharacterized protein n=1 Tax=Trichogramma kaykai TaxID=54128 RepID=A0ABD2VYY9_9HYME
MWKEIYIRWEIKVPEQTFKSKKLTQKKERKKRKRKKEYVHYSSMMNHVQRDGARKKEPRDWVSFSHGL